MAIKVAHPDESVMHLSADSTTPFEILVKTMDSVRYQLEDEVYGDPALYAKAGIRVEAGKRAPLWPDVMFTAAR